MIRIKLLTTNCNFFVDSSNSKIIGRQILKQGCTTQFSGWAKKNFALEGQN